MKTTERTENSLVARGLGIAAGLVGLLLFGGTTRAVCPADPSPIPIRSSTHDVSPMPAAFGMRASQQPASPSRQPSESPSPKTEPSSQPSHAHHRFTDTERYVKMFEDPARAEYQKPKEVVEALHLRPGQVVADIGAGSGYFSFPMGLAVGPEGKVYAIDIEPGMIDYLKSRAKKEGATNVLTILAKPDDAGLPGSSVDLAFICDTWHHIEDRVHYVRRLNASLKPGARIVIIDYQKRPLPVGPRVEDKIARDDVVKEMKEAGFSLVEEPTFLPYQYFLIFAPPKP